MSKFYLAALTVAGLTLGPSGVAHAGKIYTGGVHGSYNSDFCPQLADELAKAKFDYKCTPSLGSNENMEKVKENPTDIGFSQFDAFALNAAKMQPAMPYHIIRGDVARECLFMVTKNQELKTYGDIAAQADRLHFIMPPQGTGSASTFDYLRQIDPEGLGKATNITYDDTTDQAIQNTLKSDDNAVTLFVQFPDPSSDRFNTINKAEGFFVPVIDRNILRQQVGDQKIYFAQETEVSNPKFWRKGEMVVTACTPMVIFTGNPDLMPAGEQQLDQKDMINTVASIPTENLQPKQGFFAKYWEKTKALSADAVEKMMAASQNAREKAGPMLESAKEKAKELGGKAAEKAKELGEKAAPALESAKEKAKELGGKAVEKAKELGDAAKEKMAQ